MYRCILEIWMYCFINCVVYFIYSILKRKKEKWKYNTFIKLWTGQGLLLTSTIKQEKTRKHYSLSPHVT